MKSEMDAKFEEALEKKNVQILETFWKQFPEK